MSHDTIICANYTVLVLCFIIFFGVERFRRIGVSLTCAYTFKYVDEYVHVLDTHTRTHTHTPGGLVLITISSQLFHWSIFSGAFFDCYNFSSEQPDIDTFVRRILRGLFSQLPASSEQQRGDASIRRVRRD